MRLRDLGICVVSLVILSTPLSARALSPPEDAAYAGGSTCAECHDDHAEELARTPHGRPGFGELSDRACETCHGPGKAHADDPDDDAVRARMRVASRPPDEIAATCQKCHDGGAQMFWGSGKHARRDLTCTTCHSIHDAKSDTALLETKTVMDTCFGCHKDVRAETWKTSHHPIREGRIGCGDCHNPHGTTSDAMLKASNVNELCYACHTEKRGPFLWEHAPVRESCMNCHTPHGSNHLKLQRTSVPYLCQQCHSNTRHPGTLYDATTLPTAPGARNRLFNRACVNCHATIHGSNHPSGPYLGR